MQRRRGARLRKGRRRRGPCCLEPGHRCGGPGPSRRRSALPPFSIAGKQLGSSDERDLFAWAIELCGKVRPKALLLENVRGLSANRVAGYRQHVLDRLKEYGYIADWKLLQADHFGVSQLRPRFVLVALQEEYAPYFHWPEPNPEKAVSVGELLEDLMAENGWTGAKEWAQRATGIAPTIVGGSKKHGGADLGPTRAKRAWAEKGVDAMGVADEAPTAAGPSIIEGLPRPKLTTAMVARIQGWQDADSEVSDKGDDFRWRFHGRKTSVYRQIGNAFPPPVAKALGKSIYNALKMEGEPHDLVETADVVTDPVYKLLRSSTRPLSVDQIITKLSAAGTPMDHPTVERHLNHLRACRETSRGFHLWGSLVWYGETGGDRGRSGGEVPGVVAASG
nr:DNA cytosine methyltransferase [Streptomyces halstedii]